MHLRQVVFSVAVLAFLAPASASAECTHVVAPGESLTSIAAADGLSVEQLADANGVAPTSMLEAGSCLGIPPQVGGPVSAPASAAPVPASASTSSPGCSHLVAPGESLTSIAAANGLSVAQLASANGLSPTTMLEAGSCLGIPGEQGASSAAGSTAAGEPDSTSSAGGEYVVQPGDTLSAIAARDGTTVEQLSASNGLDPDGLLLAGSVLNIGAGTAGSSSASSQPVGGPAEGSPEDPPYPTPETVTPEQVGSIAATNGVPSSLADAIADQESGFNNDEVSSADARGVMQILPGTWSWIQQALVPGQSPLEPASASDNIRGGVLLLRSLLDSTGDSPELAAAGYYQGLPSVERYGMYPSTQQYVNDVMSLSQQFGGG
jgi:LysM repeat protein